MWNFENVYNEVDIDNRQKSIGWGNVGENSLSLYRKPQSQSISGKMGSTPISPIPNNAQLDTNVDFVAPTSFTEGEKKGMSSGTMNAIGQAGSAAGGMLNSYAKMRDAKNTPVGYTDENKMKSDAVNSSVDSVKDGVASAFGPIGMMFRGIQQLGEGAGNAIGGDGGGIVSGIFSPEAGTISAWMSDDYDFGEKLLATIPGVGGMMKNQKERKRRKRWELEKATKERNDMLHNTFTERERNNRMAEGQQQIDAEIALRQQQLGLINNY